MKAPAFLPRVLFPLGIACILVGSLDPLEGSLLVLPGVAVLTFDAYLSASRQRTLLTWALVLVACGVAAMWGVSAFGGIRFGAEGRGLAAWWGLFLLPYPAGWLLAVIGAFRSVTDHRHPHGAGPRPAT